MSKQGQQTLAMSSPMFIEVSLPAGKGIWVYLLPSNLRAKRVQHKLKSRRISWQQGSNQQLPSATTTTWEEVKGAECKYALMELSWVSIKRCI